MNRTERAIKKQYREAQMHMKKMKNDMIFKMHNERSGGLFDRKENAAKNVIVYRINEKEARKDVIDYKNRARKNHKEAALA